MVDVRPSPSVQTVSSDLAGVAEPFSSISPDVVLRSAEGVDFRVTKAVLAEALPVFRNMFSLLQAFYNTSTSEPTTEDGLPIIFVSESSDVLDPLLRTCFPVTTRSLELEYLELIEGLLVAGRKYEMDIVVHEARKALQAPHFSDPISALKVYALSCRFKMVEDARKAACDILKGSKFIQYCPELEDISAGALQRLLDYHRRVMDAIRLTCSQTNRYQSTICPIYQLRCTEVRRNHIVYLEERFRIRWQ